MTEAQQQLKTLLRKQLDTSAHSVKRCVVMHVHQYTLEGAQSSPHVTVPQPVGTGGLEAVLPSYGILSPPGERGEWPSGVGAVPEQRGQPRPNRRPQAHGTDGTGDRVSIGPRVVFHHTHHWRPAPCSLVIMCCQIIVDVLSMCGLRVQLPLMQLYQDLVMQ